MIGAAPVSATLFDGHTAQRNLVVVSASADGLGLTIAEPEGGGTPWVWPLDRLRALDGQVEDGSLTLTLHAETDDETPRDPARLVIADAGMVAWIRATAPDLRKRDVRRGTAGKLIKRLGFAVASIAVILFIILPRMSDFLAMRMPLETEVRFGKTVVAQMERFLGGAEGGLVCRNAEGEAALTRLVSRLMDGRDLQYAISFSVLDHEMVNAFAAPGGQIVILRGLLDKAGTAEEVAAVLAHEIGHVEARDPTRIMLRTAGSAGILSIILGDVSGGAVIGIIGDQLLQTAYTREAEGLADEFALDMLAFAGITSDAFADFLDRLVAMEGRVGLPEYLSSHPSTAARAARARDHAAGQGVTQSVLTHAEWQALKAICKD